MHFSHQLENYNTLPNGQETAKFVNAKRQATQSKGTMQSWSLLATGSLRIAAKAVIQLRISSQILPAAAQPFSLIGKEERRWVSYGAERGDSDWWTDNNGHDIRKREQEKYDSMKHPEKAKAHAIFMSKPGLTVSVEDFGLEHASRKLGRKVVVEGIVEKFRAQRVCYLSLVLLSSCVACVSPAALVGFPRLRTDLISSLTRTFPSLFSATNILVKSDVKRRKLRFTGAPRKR